MEKKLITKTFSGWLLMLVLLITAASQGWTQNVTVKATNGSTIAAVKGTGADDAFFNLGGFALWKHNQLNLTMTTADSDGAQIEYGQFMNPACNIFKSSGDALCLGRGATQDCYVAFSLPKGYRFTGYTIVFRRNINLDDGGYGQASFGETNENWQWNSSSTHVENLWYNSSAAKSTIKRESSSADDMGNVLYFKLTNSDGRAFITLESVELFFTAEADYTPIVPSGAFLNKTAVDIPFSTSCVDLGPIEDRDYNGTNRVSYSYQNVKNLLANMTLYEEESTKEGTNYDGTSGQVVAYNNNGTITSHNDYFQIGRAAAAGSEPTEQIYYLETPTYLELTNNARTKNPIGYRIVGAKINYTYGKYAQKHDETVSKEVLKETKQYETFYISAAIEDYTFYLTSAAGVSLDQSKAAAWFIDDDGYIRLASNPDTYLKNSSNQIITCKLSDRPAKYRIDSNGRILNASNQNQNQYMIVDFTYYWGRYYFYFAMSASDSYSERRATRTLTGKEVSVNIFETQTETLHFPAFTPSNYKLKVYDRNGGTNPELGYQEIEVEKGTEDGYLELNNLNNDAVKIGIEGVGLIQGVLTLQALNPYIDRLDIVCQEATQGTDGQYTPTGQGQNLTQTFNASDFAVSGGAFHFYVPETYDESVLFTFENLYSKYGDATYYNNSSSQNNSRYNFVKSAYWNTNSDLYATSYNPDHVYTDKISTLVKGTVEFKFNNAATVGQNGGTLEEYPFTLQRYEDDGGSFNQLGFNETQLSSTEPARDQAYLFTCDETRYNIAPTTATQHRMYAFYLLDITATKKTYSPVFKWTKVYDSSCYQDDKGNLKEDPQWGLEVLTDNIGTTADPKYGYVTVSQIVKGIEEAVGKSGAPSSKDLVLYVDGSKLLSIVEDNVTEGTTVKPYTLDMLRNGLGANVLVYLPKGTTSRSGNFAYMTEGETFRAANNITLIDKQPFFAPYDIQVPEANYATYTRLRTASGEKLVKKATIMMPFDLNVDENGQHRNITDDQTTFIMRKLVKLTTQAGTDQYGTGNFLPIKPNDEGKAPGNKPYMVEVLTEPGGEYSFIATQYGSTILATPKNTLTINGETASGLTNTGTYSGVKVPKTKNVFYFNRDKYVCSSSLGERYTDVYVQPFRAYYNPSSTSPSKMMMFEIIYDELEEDEGTVTDITTAAKPRGSLTVVTGYGYMTLTSAEDIHVTVYNIKGSMVANMKMKAGEQQTVNVPAGVYVVNKNKVIVK